MASITTLGSSTRRIVTAALTASIIFAAGVALLNQPLLKPEKFWSAASSDQDMYMGYMLKKYGEVTYVKDFSFTASPNIYRLYNPLELFILYKTYLLFDRNFPAAFYSLLVLFSLIYFFCIFVATYYFSGSYFAAFLISLFSSAWRYMGFCADAWGMAVVQNARSAYYVLPILVISALVVFRAFESGKSWKNFGSFCTVGLVAWMHPVTGYHWIAVSWTIGLIYDLVMRRRYVYLSTIRILGILVGSLPTLFSLVQNKLFGIGSSFPVEASPHQILDATIRINPTFYCHVMPYVLTRFPRPLQPLLIPAFKVIIVAGALLFLYMIIRLVWASIKQGNPLRPERRLFIVLYVLVSLLFVGFTALSNPVDFFTGGIGLYGSYAVFVFGVAFVLGANLFRMLKSDQPSVIDVLLLGIMSFSLLFSVAGSWMINFVLDQFNSPQRFWEQMRGIRIAYMVFLFWSASSLAFCLGSASLRRVGFCLAVFFGLFTLGFYAKAIQTNYTEVTREDVNFFQMTDWVRCHTDSSCLTALLIGDPWQKASEHARFKVLAQRSMTFSYDCYQLMFTDLAAVIPARERMDAITKASETAHGVDGYLVQYGPDYVVVTKDQLQMNSVRNIVYQDETYAVVKR
jgi:hypothetical protein